MRTLSFFSRNIKEIIRDPLSIIFLIVFPVSLFVILQSVIRSMNVDISYVPQFEINKMTMSMIVFSFSFITIFLGNIIASDRESCFLLRLKATPMKSYDFILGYTLMMIPLAFFQEIAMTLTGLLFGFSFSINTIISLLVLWPLSLLFIGFGIIFGIFFNAKSVGGIASLLPTMTSLLGGIFFPIDNMSGGFKDVCYFLPFANASKLAKMINLNNYDVLSNLINIFIYIIAIYVISLFTFSYRLHHDKI